MALAQAPTYAEGMGWYGLCPAAAHEAWLQAQARVLAPAPAPPKPPKPPPEPAQPEEEVDRPLGKVRWGVCERSKSWFADLLGSFYSLVCVPVCSFACLLLLAVACFCLAIAMIVFVLFCFALLAALSLLFVLIWVVGRLGFGPPFVFLVFVSFVRSVGRSCFVYL